MRRKLNRMELLNKINGTTMNNTKGLVEKLENESNCGGYYLAKSSQSVFNNYNVQQGIFYIDTVIMSESANTFIQDLRFFINTQMHLAEDLRKPVTIYLNTPGGYLSEAFAIINAIRSCPLETIGVVMGTAASAGVPILLACDVRIAFEYAELMIHSLSGGTQGTYKDMEEQWERTQKINKKLNKFIIDNSEVTEKFLQDCEDGKKDVYLTPEEAKELGLVDEIIGDMKEFMEKRREQENQMNEMFEKALEENKDKFEEGGEIKGEEIEDDSPHEFALELVEELEEETEECNCDGEDCKCGDDCKCKEVEETEEESEEDDFVQLLKYTKVKGTKIEITDKNKITDLKLDIKVKLNTKDGNEEWLLVIDSGEATLTIGKVTFNYDEVEGWALEL